MQPIRQPIDLVIVQYGDFRAANEILSGEVEETYAAQKYTVSVIADLAKVVRSVSIVSFCTDYPEHQLPFNVQCVGIDLYPVGRRPRYLALIKALRRLRPTHLVVASPLIPVLTWARLTNVEVLAMFADSFHSKRLATVLKHRLLSILLNQSQPTWVANHHLPASFDLARIGVDSRKVLPFDWPLTTSPKDFKAKSSDSLRNSAKIIYVGVQSVEKGATDLLGALRLLINRRVDVTLTMVGQPTESIQKLIQKLDLGSFVELRGIIPNKSIIPTMHEHDVVVVPSRHEYPEGLPMTIYEGLCSRTPLVVSDHPMFLLKMKDRINCLIFKAGSPTSLAERIIELTSDPALYERLSTNAEAAASNYTCPLKWDVLLKSWLFPYDKSSVDLNEYTLDHYQSVE